MNIDNIKKTKKNRKRGAKYILLGILAIILAAVIAMSLNPLRRSNDNISANLLRYIPIGTSMEEVIRAIDNNDNWRLRGTNTDFGIEMIHGRPHSASEFTPAYVDIIGDQNIRMHMGSYNIVFQRHIIVYFAFDADGYLLDIFVRKETDVI